MIYFKRHNILYIPRCSISGLYSISQQKYLFLYVHATINNGKNIFLNNKMQILYTKVVNVERLSTNRKTLLTTS